LVNFGLYDAQLVMDVVNEMLAVLRAAGMPTASLASSTGCA
jgi:hypothetical protein